MTRARWFASLTLLLFVATCCPTAWLIVSQRRGAPALPLALPRIAPGTIPIPPDIENRFDVFTAAELTAETDHPGVSLSLRRRRFSDQIDPRLAPDVMRNRIWGGLTAIERLGRPVQTPHATLTGTLSTEDDTSALDLPGVQLTGPQPEMVRIIDADGAVASGPFFSCEGLEHGTPLVGAVSPCDDPTDAGTHVVLGAAVPLRTGAVRIELVAAPSPTTSFLTFVQLSDAQIRDPDVVLLNPLLSARLDRLINSVEHDEDMARHGVQVVAAIVATINAEVGQQLGAMRPSFVIHTGDSIDAGTIGELDRFHAVMDRLDIPWFNVFGNHDVLVLGNLAPSTGDGDEACVAATSVAGPKGVDQQWLLPNRICVGHQIVHPDGQAAAERFVAGPDHLTSRRNFVERHGHEFAQSTPALTQLGATARSRSAACAARIQSTAHTISRYHGFDFLPYSGLPDRGYYAFEQDLGDVAGVPRHAVYVVLNTEDLRANEGGSAGRIAGDQYEWLTKVMACVKAYPRDLVFLFGHHQLSEIKVDGADEVDLLRKSPLLQSKQIVAYLYGHNHKHGLCADKGSCNGKTFQGAVTKFWELETGSLLNHPQEGRLVRLKWIGDGSSGMAFIETVTFAERLASQDTDFARYVRLARRGAEHDRCINGARCSPDGRVYRTDGRQTHARLFFRLP